MSNFSLTLQKTLPGVETLTFGQIKSELDYYNNLFDNLAPDAIPEDMWRSIYRVNLRVANSIQESFFHKDLKIKALNRAKKEYLAKASKPQFVGELPGYKRLISKIENDIIGIPHPEYHQSTVQGIPESIWGRLLEETWTLNHRLLMVDKNIKERITALIIRYKKHVAVEKTDPEDKLLKWEIFERFHYFWRFKSKQGWKNAWRKAKRLDATEIMDDYLMGIEEPGYIWSKYGIDPSFKG